MESDTSTVSAPLVGFLPGMLQEDDFVGRLCDGLDRMVAPICSTLDNFAAYLDVSTASQEFVRWMGSWLCVLVDETWDDERQRRTVGEAAGLFSRRGTMEGLIAQLELYAEGEWEVFESGGCTWSQAPGGELPGTADTTVRVRLTVQDASVIDGERLDALVALATPAHLRHELEIRTG